MTKKFTAMFLALALCLSLAVPAFAAEDETAAAGEPATQKEGCWMHDLELIKSYTEIDPNDYITEGHALNYVDCYKCMICGEVEEYIEATEYVPHLLRNTGNSIVLDDGLGPVTVFIYACKKCNYTTYR